MDKVHLHLECLHGMVIVLNACASGYQVSCEEYYRVSPYLECGHGMLIVLPMLVLKGLKQLVKSIVVHQLVI